jgi:hypothetical protein
MPGADIPRDGPVPSLQDVDWQPAYSHEDGDLVRLFFTPALTRSTLYQRVSGYFSEGALVLAARGLDSLISRGGRMELVAGCTLAPEDVKKIREGYALRELLGNALAEKIGLLAADARAREKLGWLSWMIANGHLDIKLAAPKDPATGEIREGGGIYHAKAGILQDPHGNRVAFTGSLNETFRGWAGNCESFSVSCSWRGEWDLKRVEKARADFRRLWSDNAKSAKVVEFPEALKRKLLQYLPAEAPSISPANTRRARKPEKPPPGPEPAPDPPTDEERRRRVWAFIDNAPKRPDGVMVAVRTSTVDPWPHQLRAYQRMLDNWPARLLISDEVGLGKTIQAGMIIRHAWLSGQARRICILAPSGIIQQWQRELYEKFNLLVPIYTGKSFLRPEHCFRDGPLEEKVSRAKWTQTPLVLVSSHLMRRGDRQKELLGAEPWDLLVLDEAHHARRMGAGTPGEKGPNRLLTLMRGMKNHARSLLLLTATPMQVHPVEIWDLLDLLGLPAEWDAPTFVEYFEALDTNPDDDKLHSLARLFQAVERDFGLFPENEIRTLAEKEGLSPVKTGAVMDALREPRTRIPLKRLSVPQRRTGLAILKAASPVRFRMSRHTRHLLRAYHKKGLLKSPVAQRKVRDLPIEMTPPERSLYDAVENYISQTYQMANADAKSAVGFIMTVYRRRVASSFHALRRTLEKRLERLENPPGPADDPLRLEEDLPQDELADETLSGEEAEDLGRQSLEGEETESIRELLARIDGLQTDSKALRLAAELSSAFEGGYDSAIVFTQYTDTMDFLSAFLPGRIDLSIGCFSGEGGRFKVPGGGWQSCGKEEIKRRLMNGDIRLLLCTDAAGEGLNLQYCGVLVNYDLPWNPMKVEQRIGRIDRIGQRFAEIRILNLAYADTVEADVYFALSRRIGLFSGVVGKLQPILSRELQPILSRIPKEFEETALAPSEQRDRLRQGLVETVRRLGEETESGGLDIDEIGAGELTIPEFPEPPFSPEDMEPILRREDLLPPGVEVAPLDAGSFSLRVPGHAEPARVTPLPKVFDNHFESHQLLLPDGPLFRYLRDRVGAGKEDLPENINHINELLR